MNFAFTQEQDLIRDSAKSFVDEFGTSERVREIMESDDDYDARVWKKIAQNMGWAAIALPEEYGGLGLGQVEVAILQEEMGRKILPSPFLSSICLAANAVLAHGSEDQKTEILSNMASGEIAATLVGDVDNTISYHPTEHMLNGKAKLVQNAMSADLLIVAASSGTGVSLFAVDPNAMGVSREALVTMDQTRAQAQIIFANVSATLLGEEHTAGPAIEKAQQLAQIALAAEQVGGAAECLERTVEYIQERVQFGRTIGSFQAVKHKCADMMVQVESARSAVYFAACIADDGSAELAEASSLAKAYCSDAFYSCAGDMIQLHGGIGITWEHDAHLFFKRARSSRSLFGLPDAHREKVARCIEDFTETEEFLKIVGEF